jgi:CHAT domain-containing protein
VLDFHVKRIKIWRYSAIAIICFLLIIGLGDRPLFKATFLKTEIAIAQPILSVANDPDTLVQQGVTFYSTGDFQAAIENWNIALAEYEQTEDFAKAAIVLENLARTYQLIGQTEKSIELWGRAIALYRQMNNVQQVGRLLSEQAQGYSRIGRYQQALSLLCGEIGSEGCAPESAIALAERTVNLQTQIAAWGSLGETYRLMGNFAAAEQALAQGLNIAQRSGETLYLASLHNSLGNTYINQAQDQYRRSLWASQAGDQDIANQLHQTAIQYDQQAIAQFQAGLQTAQHQPLAMTELWSLIGLIRSAYRVGAADTATSAYAEAIVLLPQLPDSQEKVYAALDLADLSRPTPLTLGIEAGSFSADDRCLSLLSSPAGDLVQMAIATAQVIGDRRSESFALGVLGHEYECRQDYLAAMKWTQQARWAAEQDLRSNDSLYLWEWQAGRILKAQGNQKEAIALYEQAIQTLEGIRSELLVAAQDAQFNFRDSVDPLYRELMALRLGLEPIPSHAKAAIANKENIEASLRQLDALKLAELQNYFGNDCVITTLNDDPTRIAEENPTTAIFSSIVLEDRTAIVARIPTGEELITWINVDRATIRATINQYRISLERYFEPFDPQQAKTIYNWVIAPFADALQSAQIDTLVFIQDDIFRSVPMSALYDDVQQQFLVEQYAIATTPSLSLTTPKQMEPRTLSALVLGLSQAVTVDGQRFQALANVDQETLLVAEKLPGSRRLLNQDFTYDRLQQELSKNVYPIIHIATHGKFGTDPKDTFLLAGDGQKLTISHLDNLLRSTPVKQQLELLSLTACQTAVGDNRAALGLAGVAVQSGAKSAIASLWFIDDQATADLMDRFYANWVAGSRLSKAKALQTAQVSIIQSEGAIAHPAYWASFLLIGNWL